MVTSKWIHGEHELPHEIRRAVFIDELAQSEEADAFDEFAMHVVMFEEGTPAGTGRIYHDGRHFRMDKICVLPQFRNQKIADLMVRLMLYKAVQFAPELRVLACADLQKFFEKFGFKPCEAQLGANIEMKLQKEELVFPSDCGRN